MSKITNINRAADGWIVRIVRNGREYSKYFRFSNGGIRGSLAQAKKWRLAQLKKLGPRKWHQGPKRKKAVNNSSGITGVSKNPYGRWVATWQEDGKQRFKTFRTRKEAKSFRAERLRQLS